VPSIAIIVMSGHANETLQLGDLASRVELLPKPFAPSDLQRKIASVLAARQRP
jgi:CheY-like chemotaxis protein